MKVKIGVKKTKIANKNLTETAKFPPKAALAKMIIGIKSGKTKIIKSELLPLADKVRLEPKETIKFISKLAIREIATKSKIKLPGIFKIKAMIGKIIINGKVLNSQLAIIFAKIIISKT